MTKTVLAMLLGAICASSWWAQSEWPSYNEGVLILPAIISSMGVAAWIIGETLSVFESAD